MSTAPSSQLPYPFNRVEIRTGVNNPTQNGQYSFCDIAGAVSHDDNGCYQKLRPPFSRNGNSFF